MKRMIVICIACVVLLCTSWGYAEPSYQLLNSKEIPSELGGRLLTDTEVNSIKNASASQLKKSIATFGDYVAWLEAVNATYYMFTTSNDKNQVTMGDGFAFDWAQQMLGANMVAEMAQYVLEDDYPGIQTVVALLFDDYGNRDTLCANAIPVNDGYIVIGADLYAKNCLANPSGQCTMAPFKVKDLSAVIDYCQSDDRVFAGHGRLAQVLLVKSTARLVLNVDATNQLYVAAQPEIVTEIYRKLESVYPDPNSAPTLKSMNVSIREPAATIHDYTKALEIKDGGIATAAEAICSIQDCMNYVYYSKYVAGDGDRFIPVSNDLEWHYNYKPNVVFARHTGCCGATSGLVAYLLEGDYDEVGFVGITYQEGFGGGHVVNYIKSGQQYYVFDIFAWAQSGYRQEGLNFSQGKTIEAAVLAFGRRLGNHVKCMYAYTNPKYGDAPIGWSTAEVRVSYLFRDYAENVKIILETPQEGYVYEFVDADPALIEGIDLIRSVW